MIRRLIILLLIIALNACTTIENPKVEIYGALFEMMHQGNLSTRIDLNSLKGKKHIYGLGALTDLKGEILIMDSNVFISSETQNGDIEISNSYNYPSAMMDGQVSAIRKGLDDADFKDVIIMSDRKSTRLNSSHT